jgi:hypothetical protein
MQIYISMDVNKMINSSWVGEGWLCLIGWFRGVGGVVWKFYIFGIGWF